MTVSNQIVPCVGAVIHDDRGRLLLIRRGQEPGIGLWSLPGGRVEPHESDQQAVVREVAEETGLRVVPGRLLGRVHRPAPGGEVYQIADYFCTLAGPAEPTPGSDADDVRWVTRSEYAELTLVSGLAELLAEWNVLPAR